MQRDFLRLENRIFDLLIVGGGITGATLAWDAALRGLEVVLVDRADFGSATSSATSKLIHGGLRYLKNGEFGLVRESLRERSILQSIAPHLVRPLPFLVPTYKQGGMRKWMIRVGLTVYDLLSLDQGKHGDPDWYLPRHRMLSKAQALQLEPGLHEDGLTGGAIYYDCSCEPDRLTLEFLIGAFEQGAIVVNHAPVKKLIVEAGRVKGAEVEDRLSGRRLVVQARMVANVAGPWVDEIDELCVDGRGVKVRRSKGIHIVTRAVANEHALVLMTQAGRHFFIIPWRGHSLIGTTDTEYTGDPDRLSVQRDELLVFLSEINQAYPSAELTERDVLYQYAGVRPLVRQDKQAYQASRRYEIVDHHENGRTKGLVSAVGGKYTTSRNLARKLTDRIMSHLGRKGKPCMTASKRLPGAPGERVTSYLESCLGRAGSKAPKDVVEHLVWTYGSRYRWVLALVEKDSFLGERVSERRPEILAQVVYAIKHEMANSLCDVIVRRTGIGTLGHPGDTALRRIVDLAASLLGWSDQQKAWEKQNYINKLRGFSECLTPPLGGAGES